MGGRGAASGISVDGKPYGTEFETIHHIGNIKYVAPTNSKSVKSPLETMTSGRIYATVNSEGRIKSITYYDKHNRKFKQIDVTGTAHKIEGKSVIPHTHQGYTHDEKGTREPTPREQKMIDRVVKMWENYRRGK